MWTEFLNVKTRLDPGEGKKMEKSLNERFSRVAGRFGKGLMQIAKGSLFGISLGLLSRLLNPIEALEEKIKGLLGQSEDIKDLADRFNTTPGKLKVLQDTAQSMGVSPEKLNELLTKFAQGVETAIEEFRDPFGDRSASTVALQGFRGEKDMAEGFRLFLARLKAEGQGKGQDIVVGDAKTKVHLTPEQSRQSIEKAVFGERLTGNTKRLVDGDLNAQAKKINEPSPEQLSRTIDRNANLQDQKNILDTQNKVRDFIDASARVNAAMIKSIAESEAREEKKLTAELSSFQDMKRGADALNDIKDAIGNLAANVTQMLGMLKQLTAFLPKVTNSKWWNKWLDKGGF